MTRQFGPAGPETVRGRSGEYRRLVTSSALANLSDGIGLVALPWYTTTITDSPIAIAAVAGAAKLPWLLVSLVAGVIGDRVDRGLLMTRSAWIKSGVLGAFSLLVLLGVDSLYLVLMVAFMSGVFEVFLDNTAQAVIPSIVHRSRLERANGTLWGVEEASERFLGPPAGGLLIGGALALPFGIQAGLMAMAGVVLTGLKGVAVPRRRNPEPIGRMMRAGLSWLRGHQLLWRLAVLLSVLNLVRAAPAAIVVLYVQEVLGLGAEEFGLVLTAGAVGGVIGSQVAPRLASLVPPGTTIWSLLGVQGGLLVAIAVFPTTPVFVACTVALSFVAVWWTVITASLRQRLIPDELLGRVSSAYRMAAWGTLPLGAAVGGGLVTAVELLGADRALSLRAPYGVAGMVLLALVPHAAKHLSNNQISLAKAAAGD